MASYDNNDLFSVETQLNYNLSSKYTISIVLS